MCVITFFNPKGGVGKSSLTNTIANEIIFQSNNQLLVCVIEIDPQATNGKKRKENLIDLRTDTNSDEFLNLTEDKKTEIRQLQKSYLLLQQQCNFISYPIISIDTSIQSEITKALNIIESGKYDIIFIDFPGTKEQEGTSDFFSYIEHMIIPVTLSKSDTIAVDDFCDWLKNIEFTAPIYFVANKYQLTRNKQWDNYIDALQQRYPHVSIFSSKIKETAFADTNTILPAAHKVNLNNLSINDFPILDSVSCLAKEIMNLIDRK